MTQPRNSTLRGGESMSTRELSDDDWGRVVSRMKGELEYLERDLKQAREHYEKAVEDARWSEKQLVVCTERWERTRDIVAALEKGEL